MGFKEIKLPDLGEGITEGEIVKINVSVGDSVSMDQALIEVMTDKASMEVPSTIDGIVKDINVKTGDMINVGSTILKLEVDGDVAEEAPAKQETKTAAPQESKPATKKSASSSSRTLAIPATRKMAEEFGVSLDDVATTGDKVTREDLIRHIQSSSGKNAMSPTIKTNTNLEIEGGEIKREPLIGVKRLMFESMTASKATIPHFTILESACAKHLVSVRTKLKERLMKEKGIKLTYLPFFMKALLACMKEFPIFNSSYDDATKEIIYKKAFHLGFAVDSPQGLVVPVIKNVQDKSVIDVAKEVGELGNQTRSGTVKRENLKNASITITNIGSVGGLYGTPIINPPEMAILGVYRMYKQVVQNEKGEFEQRDFINFSLTCDHRFIDGATATRFLRDFVARIEEPSLLILD